MGDSASGHTRLVRTRMTLALGALLASCMPAGSAAPAGSGGSAAPSMVPTLRYVALGDSYTIGTSVRENERWPNQLVAALGGGPPALELAGNPAVNGYTTRDVIADELPKLEALRPEFVSLLIGVNDVIQGVSEDEYRRNLELILDDVIARAGARRVVVVTTPDYTVTPAGADYGDPTAVSAAIRRYNAILTEVANARTVPVVDIYDLSLRVADDRSLVAGDGLHPSGAQYALWVERILPVVEDLLGG